jgi:putative FmdB family regulatory protein
MPTYEYECRSCSTAFEAFQSMSDDALSSCPSCGGRVRRLIGKGMGIIFKGSGFYKNDSRKPDPDSAAAAPKTSAAPVASDSKGEKPAAKESAAPAPSPPSASEKSSPKTKEAV